MKIFTAELQKNKIQMMALVVIFGTLALVLDLNFILRPQIGGVIDLSGRAARMKADLKNAQSDIANIGLFKKEIASYEGKIGSYEKMLPAEKEIPALLEYLSEIAGVSNVRIVGIVPVTAPVSKDVKDHKDRIYQEIPILITAKSGYHELGAFISKLENSDRFMKVIDIDIKANKATPALHDVELMVLTYILLKEK